MAPRNIDRRRAELLARRDEIHTATGPHGLDIPADYGNELDEIDAALKLLDEAANRGDDRPYPRIKIRKVPQNVPGQELARPWLITQRDAPEIDEERVIAWQSDVRTAHVSAMTYIALQRFLGERLGGVL